MTVADDLALGGRLVVVAGAGGGGIGTAVCRALAGAGASVLALDVRPEARASVEEAVAGTAGPHRCVIADVRDPAQVAAALEDAGELGALHGLVHVAGGIWPPQWGSLLSMDPGNWDEVLELNLRSAFVTMRAVATRLVAEKTGGSIVPVSSIAGLSAMPYAAPYAAAKAGLVSLTRTAALEWGPSGIRVNAVAPGSVRTPKSASRRRRPGRRAVRRRERCASPPAAGVARRRGRCRAVLRVGTVEVGDGPGPAGGRGIVGATVVPGP